MFVIILLLQELIEKLEIFASSEENETVDFVSVVFMGHGSGAGLHAYLKCSTETDQTPQLLEIWNTCSQIFNKNHLTGIPKIFIAQLCRSEDAIYRYFLFGITTNLPSLQTLETTTDSVNS